MAPAADGAYQQNAAACGGVAPRFLPPYRYEVTRYWGHAGAWHFYATAEINGLPYEVMFLSEPYQDVNEFLAQAIPFAEQALKNRVQAEQKAMQQANDDQQAS